MSSFKRRADQTDLDPIDISTPSSSSSSAFSKLPRRDADEDKSASASASRHSIYTGSGLTSAGPGWILNTASLKHESKMAEDVHVPPAEPRRDKGKGKMKYLPVLPEEVYRRIWSIYYQDCATRWHDKMSYTGALVPLLVSPEITQTALPVLYAYPLLTYDTITPFLASISAPSSFYHGPLAPLVRSLCVQATPERIDYTGGNFSTSYIHACLGDVLGMVPHLVGFTLKDTLITNAQDGRALFAALKHIRPKKVRLEMRMWDLHDSPIGQDLLAATQQSVHCYSLIGADEPIPAVDRFTGHLSTRARAEGGTHFIQEAWRNALWRGQDLELPAWWIASERPRDMHAELAAAAQQQEAEVIVVDDTDNEDDVGDDAGGPSGGASSSSVGANGLGLANLRIQSSADQGNRNDTPDGEDDHAPERREDRRVQDDTPSTATPSVAELQLQIARLPTSELINGSLVSLANPQNGQTGDVPIGPSISDALDEDNDWEMLDALHDADIDRPHPGDDTERSRRRPLSTNPDHRRNNSAGHHDYDQSEKDADGRLGGGSAAHIGFGSSNWSSRRQATGPAWEGLPSVKLGSSTFTHGLARPESVDDRRDWLYGMSPTDHLPDDHPYQARRSERLRAVLRERDERRAHRQQLIDDLLPIPGAATGTSAHHNGIAKGTGADYTPTDEHDYDADFAEIDAAIHRSTQRSVRHARQTSYMPSFGRWVDAARGPANWYPDDHREARLARKAGDMGDGAGPAPSHTLSRVLVPGGRRLPRLNAPPGSAIGTSAFGALQYRRRADDARIAESATSGSRMAASRNTRSPLTAHQVMRGPSAARSGVLPNVNSSNGLPDPLGFANSWRTHRPRIGGVANSGATVPSRSDGHDVPTGLSTGWIPNMSFGLSGLTLPDPLAPATSSTPPARIADTRPWEVRLIEPAALSHALARALRDALARLLEDWTPGLEAFSVVAFDPLASLIVRSPHADFWLNVPVPHIRVRLPRAINSLAVFKGAKECARDRAKARETASANPAAQGGVHDWMYGGPFGHGNAIGGLGSATLHTDEATEDEGDDDDDAANVVVLGTGGGVGTAQSDPMTSGAGTGVIASGFHHGQNATAGSSNNSSSSSNRRLTLRDVEDAARVVGGDGHGGGLVHPDVRIFEIEVNTTRELGDQIWEQAGWQLPSVLCRMLIGQDWDDVRIGPSSTNSIVDDEPISDLEDGLQSASSADESFAFDSDWDDGSTVDGDEAMQLGSGEAEEAEETNSTFDAVAARAQAERIAQRRRAREQEQGKKEVE